MKALVVERRVARFAAARVAGTFAPGSGARFGPLRLTEVDEPHVHGDGWRVLRPRLSGICGSDLATIDAKASRYFEPIVSFPFVPGHEVVADTDEGQRVVVEPVLGCRVRGIEPMCQACTRGDLGGCERLAFGRLAAGLQTGYCCDTGGGWGVRMVAHDSQVHAVPDDWDDAAAVMVEPTACAVHGVLTAPIAQGDLVVVQGAGTVGLLTIAALRRFTPAGTVVVGARHPHQRRLAHELGADHAVAPDEVARLVRRLSGSLAYGDQLTGGADVVLDCVGDSSSIAAALAVVRPKGTIQLVGMPGEVSLDLTPLWHREVRLVGAYAYGTEVLLDGSRRRTFDLAFELVAAADLGRLVSAAYRLGDHRAAIEHAASAGRRGAVKIVFDLRKERTR